jgi:hypothetical protein
MKRDWDVIREILQKVEDLMTNETITSFDYDNTRTDVITYHIKLLYQAGLIEAVDCSSMDGDEFIVNGLTWEGHEFLESIRSESIWKKTKSKIIEKGGSMTFDIIKTVAIELFKSSIGT